MNAENKNLMQIHFAVLLFGLSGLFGKLLLLPSTIIVFGRVFFSSIFLFVIMFCLKRNIRLKNKSHYFYLLIMGLILAVHWTTFFKAIQISTVAIGVLTFSTFPVFTTFLEPYFFKEKIKLKDVIIAISTFSGVIFIVPRFELGNNLTQGVLCGIVSGFAYAVLSMMNRKYVKEYSSLLIAFYEQAVAAVLLIPSLFIEKAAFTPKDIVLLVLLGTVFTGISHSLFINGLKSIRTQVAGIISSLEPVYGIIFAAFLLGEIPNSREILGGVIILSTVFYSTIKHT